MPPIDLTAPVADLGIQLIIEATTDADVRHRAATDPGVVGIVERAAQLDDAQRRRIHEAWIEHFRIHRLMKIRIFHRVRKTSGVTELHVRALNERIFELFACPTKGQHAENCTWAFTCAIEDAVYARLAREHLTADEQRLFNGPWVDIAGPVVVA